MNTEDDTFKKLRQLPFEQMKQIHSDNYVAYHASYNPWVTSIEQITDFEKYGWDPSEYTELHWNQHIKTLQRL